MDLWLHLQCMGVQTFYGIGPHSCVLVCMLKKKSVVPNHLNRCVIFIVYTLFTNVAAGRIIQPSRPHVWDPLSSQISHFILHLYSSSIKRSYLFYHIYLRYFLLHFSWGYILSVYSFLCFLPVTNRFVLKIYSHPFILNRISFPTSFPLLLERSFLSNWIPHLWISPQFLSQQPHFTYSTKCYNL